MSDTQQAQTYLKNALFYLKRGELAKQECLTALRTEIEKTLPALETMEEENG